MGRFRLNIRHKKEVFFIVGDETQGQAAQRVCRCPTQETFKVRFDWTLSYLIQLKVPLLQQGWTV